MPDLKISFFDVGQGDGTFIVFPNGITMLVDLGTTKNKGVTLPEITNFFSKQYSGLKKIDFLVLTHGDLDHYNLIYEFMETSKITFGQVIIGGGLKDYYESYYTKCAKCKRKIEIGKKVILKNYPSMFSTVSFNCNYKGCNGKTTVQCNSILTPDFDQWLYEQNENKKVLILDSDYSSFPKEFLKPNPFGNVTVVCMAANVKDPSSFSTKNTGSIVLRLYYSGVSIILSGDATYLTEKFIIEKFVNDKGVPIDFSSTILKVAHHGSARTSNSSDWVIRTNPEWIFFSADRTGNAEINSGHKLPSQATIDTFLQFGAGIKKAYSSDIEHCYIANYGEKYFNKSRALDTFDSDSSNKDKLVDQVFISSSDRDVVKGNYYEVKTKYRIFSTLCKLDYPLYNKADTGVRYDITIGNDSQITFSVSDKCYKDVSNFTNNKCYFLPAK